MAQCILQELSVHVFVTVCSALDVVVDVFCSIISLCVVVLAHIYVVYAGC